MARRSILLLLLTTGIAAGCGARLLERWHGRPVLTRDVPVPIDRLWEHVAARAKALDLILTEVRPGDHVIQFDWITAPGDGRLYLRCSGRGPIGSASLRPRVTLRGHGTATAVVIASEVRATAATACESTGQFERWLFSRFAPAIAGALDAPDASVGPQR